jgi:hypothetical protein
MTSDNNEPKRVASAGEYLPNEPRYGVQDIRQRRSEEAWFGRVVTSVPRIEARTPGCEATPEPERRLKFADVRGPRVLSLTRDAHQKERQEKSYRELPEVERE